MAGKGPAALNLLGFGLLSSLTHVILTFKMLSARHWKLQFPFLVFISKSVIIRLKEFAADSQLQ